MFERNRWDKTMNACFNLLNSSKDIISSQPFYIIVVIYTIPPSSNVTVTSNVNIGNNDTVYTGHDVFPSYLELLCHHTCLWLLTPEMSSHQITMSVKYVPLTPYLYTVKLICTSILLTGSKH